MNFNSMKKDLDSIARELEKNAKNYSADEQGILTMKARAIVATVQSNAIQRKYSFNEDD